MRKVFLDELPKKKYGNKETIDWKNSIGYKVKFIYDDIEGEIEIIDIINQKIILKYDNNEPYTLIVDSFKKCKLASVLKLRQHEFKYNVGDKITDNNRNLTIIDMEYRKIKGVLYKFYFYKCNVCGWDKGQITEQALNCGKGCTCCSGHIVIEGINDIPTTAPWMVKYFQGGYDEAKLYTYSSHRMIVPICPYCGKIHEKPMQINRLFLNRKVPCVCSDSVSYPEKFMYGLLKQLNINFIYQLTKTNLKWCNKYSYDFYIKEFNMIIETHGLQHYKDNISWNKKEGYKKDKENDIIKENLAISNNIIKYIVIDARYSNSNWIKTSIMNSKLPSILKFSENDIDWLKCEEFALKNIIKDICDYKNSHPITSNLDLVNLYQLSTTTIAKYLKVGYKLGWC